MGVYTYEGTDISVVAQTGAAPKAFAPRFRATADRSVVLTARAACQRRAGFKECQAAFP